MRCSLRRNDDSLVGGKERIAAQEITLCCQTLMVGGENRLTIRFYSTKFVVCEIRGRGRPIAMFFDLLRLISRDSLLTADAGASCVQERLFPVKFFRAFSGILEADDGSNRSTERSGTAFQDKAWET